MRRCSIITCSFPHVWYMIFFVPSFSLSSELLPPDYVYLPLGQPASAGLLRWDSRKVVQAAVYQP